MKQLTKVEEKEQLGNRIKLLVNEINKEIELSNNELLAIRITFTQNNGLVLKNSFLNVSVYEIISY